MKSKKWLGILGLLFVFLGLPLFLAWNFILAPVLQINDQFSRLIGKPESEAVAVLGQPTYRISPEQAKVKGIDFAIKDRGFLPTPDRPIHKEVLFYVRRAETTGKDFAVYLFVADDGRVEAVDFAGE
jgi:hypothetical protein